VSTGTEARRATSPSARAGRVAVIGVGNPFRGDDGIGHRVVDLIAELQEAERRRPNPPRGRPLELRWSDGEPSRLLDDWQGIDVCVVVDAMVTGAEPGTVRLFDALADQLPAAAATSSHGSGVAEAVALGTALDDLPRRLLVVGVEVAHVADGQGLSEELEAVVPRARRVVLAAIAATPSALDVHPSAQRTPPGDPS
jgi:hydrogenase maturation protease